MGRFRSIGVSYEATMNRWGGGDQLMSGVKKDNEQADIKSASTKNGRDPGWASGLKKLYDSVVDEPLPDSFKDLLSRLDDQKK